MLTTHVSSAVRSSIAGGIVFVTWGFSPAWASLINPLSQDRIIEANSEIAGDEGDDSDSAFDFADSFGLFDSEVSVQSQLGGEPITVSATGAQTSEILSDSIYGSGFTITSGDDGPEFAVSALGSSFMFVSFELAEAVNYELTGELSALFAGESEAIASFSLNAIHHSVIDVLVLDGIESLDSSGKLGPGAYQLTVFAGSSLAAAGAESTSSFNFNLEFSPIPEPYSLTLLLVAFPLLGHRRR